MTYRNLAELHRLQAEKLGPRPALRFKQYGVYRDLSWTGYLEQVQACAAALISVGIAAGERVGLLSENRMEWLLADLGIMTAGAVNVPPHAPLTSAQIQYQLADAEVRWLFVANRAQLAKIQAVRGELPLLKGIVCFEDGISAGVQSWQGFLQHGRRVLPELRSKLIRRENALGTDSLATLMYTSGTTGVPKGVMLTHGNLLSNAVAMNEGCPRDADSVVLSWLPFSHIYARTVDHYLNLVTGATLWLAVSADTVVENLAEARPTHISCVPRFYEKVLAAVSGADEAAAQKKLRDIFGPRITWLTSGGAPLPPAIAQSYQRAGLLLLQGYGLTESSPVITFNNPHSYKLETVGRAVPGVEVRIADDGEILTRGPHVMAGYWKNPAATAEAIRDGWLHTGDVGQLDAEGFLTITGRKKDLLVLSNGKKVAPTHIEGLLLADPCIDQAVVYGEGRNFLTALIVPHWDNVRKLLRDQQSPLASSSAEELASHPEVRALFEARVQCACTKVSSSENVKRFIVLPRAFSVESEELTVSLKLRRNVVFTKYKERLNELYQ